MAGGHGVAPIVGVVLLVSGMGLTITLASPPTDPDPEAIAARQHPLNHPPSAQAGPPLIVVDGGPNDLDDQEDDQAAIRFDGHRTSDVDVPSSPVGNHTGCDTSLVYTPTPPYRFYWYEGSYEKNKSVFALGEAPEPPQRDFGFHAYTLEVVDECGERDFDQVQAFVAKDKTKRQHWEFENGLPHGWVTDGIAHTTQACNVDSQGSYLAFNLGPNATGDCHYESNEPLQGTATFTHDPGDTDILALEFQTRYDTRDGIGTLQEELLANTPEDLLHVQASLDAGQTWTQPNHTFQHQRIDDDLDDGWVRAGGIYDLRNHTLVNNEITFRFSFDSRTAVTGGGYGWLVDDIRLTELTR